MKKRVALARAIALDPDIILYDEPTTGLDPIMAEQINELIRSLQHEVERDVDSRHARPAQRQVHRRQHRADA